MYDVPDPEQPGRTVPSRMALRGQRPGPADVAAARRCRLRHDVLRGDELAGAEYVMPADLTGRPSDIGSPEPIRNDSGRCRPDAAFVVFDGGLTLDHAARLRPPDERWGDDGRTWVWSPRGVFRGDVISGPDGVQVAVSMSRRSLEPDALADLIACLAAAQDDQRCRFAVGDPTREDAPS